MVQKVAKHFTGKFFMLLLLFGSVLCTWGQGSSGVAYAANVTGNEWTTPEDVRVGQTDARAIMIPFDDVEGAKENPTLRLGKENSPNYIDLDGTWKFYWVSKPADKPNVEGVTTIPSNYFDITVPSSWQTNMKYAGWKGDEIDWPIYNNQDYPWEAEGEGVAKQPKGNGSAAPTAYNPVGTYMRTVNIDAKDIGTQRFILTFLGVESGYYVYVNGQAVGYDEDSFTTGEFDITDYVKAGENLITVQVYHYTTGSYLENQDMIYYAGIHRDVFITKQPKVSIFDYNVETTFDNHDYTSGKLDITVDVANTSSEAASRKVLVYLYDSKGSVVSSVNGLEKSVNPGKGKTVQAEFSAAVANPKLWSAELPNLYTLVFELRDSSGKTLQTVGKRIGFREFYMEGKGTNSEMRINGQNIEFYGVCRGEADPAGGHHIPYETIVKDVQNAKQLNINSIRTSHFPPDPNLIELADEYGLYIMDEANVETHNGRDKITIPTASQHEPGSGRVFPGNDKRYQNAMIDRMTSLVMRDKNNASVIIYSLGNECGTDVSDRLAPDPQEGNFNRMIDVIKELDGEKLIHDQQWNGNQRVDMEGTMYPAHNKLNPGTKPFIMMEYQHSMGNAGGDFEIYTDKFESDARFQGGFLWDYVDQSAYTPQEGKSGANLTVNDLFFGFDHSWKLNSDDYNFCVNGFIFPDRTWSPQAYEVKYRYQDLKFVQTDEQKAAKKITLKNFNRFKNANYYDIEWSVLENGTRVSSGKFTAEQVNLAPPTGRIAGASTKEVTVPYTIDNPKQGAEYLLQIEYKLKNSEVYAEKGYVQGSEQFEIDVKGADQMVALKDMSNVTTQNTENEVTITGTTDGKTFKVVVDKKTGLMKTYQANGKDLIAKAPVGSFFRAEPDQNAAINGTGWKEKGEAYDAWCGQGENMKDVSVTVKSVVPQMTTVSVNAKLQNGSGYATSYSVYGNGTVVVTAKLTPSAQAPAQLGEYGMRMQIPEEFEKLTWYGRGPSETYWNRKAGNMVGVWNGTVTDQFVPYVRIQEAGNKTDVRWMALQNEDGVGILAGMTYGEGYSGNPLEAVALHYTPEELSTHQSGHWYPYQANATKETTLRLLTHQKGVGNVTWGTEPVSAVINKTDTELLDYSYTLMPLFSDTDPMEKSREILEEAPEVPAIMGIALEKDGEKKVVSGFSADNLEYTVVLPTGYEGYPTVSAIKPSSLTESCVQATDSSPTAVLTVQYKPESGALIETVYKVHFEKVQSGEAYVQLSSLVDFPAVQLDNTNGTKYPKNGKLLYAFSGYNLIYKDKNQSGGTLTLGPASTQSTYENGFAGNAQQIIDIDISQEQAKSFSATGGVDWLLKPNNDKTSIKFEIWAHKDVSQLTETYYETNVDRDKNGVGSADWTATGWKKLGGSEVIKGNAADPKYEFQDVSLVYEEDGKEKSYQAIRLVIDADRSNSHDQGVWGNPRILCAGVENPGSGFEEPAADLEEIMINGVPLKGFSADQTEYNVKISSGAKLPQVTATVRKDGGIVPVKISKVAVPGDVTVSYDAGTPKTFTIHFTRDAAIEGTKVSLADVVDIPSLTGPDYAQNGNLLYAFSGKGAIYKNKSDEAGTKLTLKQGEGTKTYEKGFAGAAQQVIDIDISSQKAGIFRADAGAKGSGAVKFEVWAHKSISLMDYSATKFTADGKNQTDFAKEGWVKLAESGNLTSETDLHSFHTDLTYLEGTEAKSYEALRLVVSSEADGVGIWGDPSVEFIKAGESLMLVPALNNANAEEDGVSVPVLLSGIDTSQDRVFYAMLAAYDKENRMVGCTTRIYNAKDSGGNIDETVKVEYDVAAVGDTTIKFMVWDAENPYAPIYGVFTKNKSNGFDYGKVPYVSGIAEHASAAAAIDAENDTVTVTGTGFEPNSSLTLRASYEKEEEDDHIAQVTADEKGNFTYTYASNYNLEADSYLDVIVGGNGLNASVKATTREEASQGREPVKNIPGRAVYNDKKIDVSKVKGLFTIDENAGEASYSLLSGGTAEAVLGEDHKTLIVSKPGTARIGLETAQTSTHASGKRIVAVLTVNNNSDRSVLAQAAALAKKKAQADYSAESYAALQAALADAERMAVNPNAFQSGLDHTTLALLEAVCALEPTGSAEPVDMEVVDAAIALAGIKKESDYKTDSWASLQTALSAAEEVTEETSAADKKKKTMDLLTAVKGLVIETNVTVQQDFNADTKAPAGWNLLQNANNQMAIQAVSTAPAGYPASVTGNALRAYGGGSGPRGGRVAYSEARVPQVATFEFDFYINTAPSNQPNFIYLEQGDPVSFVAENGTVTDTGNSFFALIDGKKNGTLQYYNYNEESWVDIPSGSGKWLHAEVTADFGAGSVIFKIMNGGTTLAEVTQENAMKFADTVTTFNRITIGCQRNSGTTNCDIWLDNFKMSGSFETEGIKVRGMDPDKSSIAVAKGTSLDDVKAMLAEIEIYGKVASGSIVPTFENNASLWTVADYDPNAVGTYQASAPLTLPEGFAWADGVDGTLNISVVVQEKADKKELSTQIERTKVLNEDDYTPSSWAVMQEALAAAETLMAQEDASQTAVDAAAEALKNAIDALEKKDSESEADKSALNELIIKAEGKTEAEYTEESWSVFAEKLAAAKAIAEKADATQTEVDQAKEELQAALDGLKKKDGQTDPTVDKSELNELITKAEGKTEADYTEETWSVFAEKLAAAKAIAEKADATQTEVDQAKEELQAALDGLKKKDGQTDPTVDKSELNELITKAEGKTEADYTEETWSVFAEKLAAAKAIAEKADATQTEVDQAKEELQAALDGLKRKDGQTDPDVDKSKLNELITKAEGMLEEDYTEETWSIFAEKLAAAKAVAEKAGATQTEVDQAKEELQAAMDALARKDGGMTDADKQQVADAILNAGNYKADDYTPESWAAVQAALDNLKAIQNKPGATAKEAKDAIEALQKALDGLKRKDTAAVQPTVTSVSFTNKKTVTLNIKRTVKRTAKVTATGAGNFKVVYSSKSRKVASVDPNTGKVTAKSAGRTVITASCGGKTDSYVVRVKPAKVTKITAKSKSKGKVSLKWKKTAGASGYEIQISDSSKKLKKAKVIKIKKGKIIKKDIKKFANGKKLKGGKKVYIRMRAYKKVGSDVIYGDYSKAKTCKVKK